ncbi:MAG TPA: hypothetical protein VFA10_10325 [Ktedonobacteraceae bacterium]|nr:hypothetical protein [Ktedonobacteraceae bacterium]
MVVFVASPAAGWVNGTMIAVNPHSSRKVQSGVEVWKMDFSKE